MFVNKDYLPTLNKAKKIEARNKKIAWAVYYGITVIALWLWPCMIVVIYNII